MIANHSIIIYDRRFIKYSSCINKRNLASFMCFRVLLITIKTQALFSYCLYFCLRKSFNRKSWFGRINCRSGWFRKFLLSSLIMILMITKRIKVIWHVLKCAEIKHILKSKTASQAFKVCKSCLLICLVRRLVRQLLLYQFTDQIRTDCISAQNSDVLCIEGLAPLY